MSRRRASGFPAGWGRLPWPPVPDAGRREAAAFHHAAGEFVDNDHLTRIARAAHDIIAVFLEQLMRAQGIGHVMDKSDVLNVVNGAVGFQ